ncbi:unnamed protein product [Ceratitis capitata]|uniref:(Mediterranean fruit fly) hypothetical protein n=1 Tax=Ceratitis capitata TaxID=7213 RepID=A0A811UH48_CERCA|nr:unnamed protein product [Ceratitis capitata]
MGRRRFGFRLALGGVAGSSRGCNHSCGHGGHRIVAVLFGNSLTGVFGNVLNGGTVLLSTVKFAVGRVRSESGSSPPKSKSKNVAIVSFFPSEGCADVFCSECASMIGA